MTEEQERLFEKMCWNKQITEGTLEYRIVKDFFELGINITVDKALEIVQAKSDKMYVHTLPADDTNGLFCFSQALKEIKELKINYD